MTTVSAVRPAVAQHELEWRLAESIEGGAALTLRCVNCRRAFYHLGYDWTPGASPRLEDVLAKMRGSLGEAMTDAITVCEGGAL